ncbi:MAG: phytanoyl-CoA dioxygenase family protein [Gemmatimonadetes bacterium]|jgi:phytanoyl-CoA hydroxylase|nr:phytanoyl-CoA dioxygenase family protein [Gemmatimonadota bacterium]MBT6147780.1 phytanoyl-CoA dioxygenase family protein [Gemmatimonadota bacterium]MBT7862646.1 phytanoyl-CoA dioxygenase family protein [Gemmatimonadota bacterium]
MTPAQIEQYWREGFLTEEIVFSPDEVLKFASAYDACLDRLREQDGLRNIRSGQLEDGTQTEVNQIRCAHLFHPVFADLVRDTRILDRVEALIGANLRLILCQGLYKPAQTGGEIGWHQDDYYFGVSKKDAVVSCWMAFDDVTPENGCMWVIPRAQGQLWEHESVEPGGYVMSDPDESAALPLPLKAGQIMFHHGATPHRTLKNQTDRSRRALAIHYMDATATILRGNRENEPPENTPILRGHA